MGDLTPDGTPYTDEEQERLSEALALLTAHVITDPPPQLTLDVLSAWHAAFTAAVPRVLPGVYRTAMRAVFGAYRACDPHEVLPRLERLLRRTRQVIESADTHHAEHGLTNELVGYLIEQSAYLHAELVAIHPFHDGNGRMSRLVQAWMLEKYGVPAPRFQDKARYLTEINKYHSGGDYRSLADLTRENLARQAQEANTPDT